MKHMSNAFFHQVEITQIDRWEAGPLELVFVPLPRGERLELAVAAYDWNATQRSGFLRARETMQALQTAVPFLESRRNPNMILALEDRGTSALDVMLAGLLPDRALERHLLKRHPTNLSLTNFYGDLDAQFGARARSAFAEHIWSCLAPKARLGSSAFSPNAPLRLLAGDTRYWAHRLYRLALDRRDRYFEPTTHEDDGWKPLEALTAEVMASLVEEDRAKFVVTRPLMGGDIWDVDDPDEREDVLQSAIDGDGVMESLAPIVELLHSHHTHEDFSPRHSWIKEDFERSFYSKRAKLKVDIVETIDDVPAYDVDCPYEQILFRDILAMLDQKERRLVLALRMGKNASTIARESGLHGHASVSRRIAALKAKLKHVLL